MTDAFAVIGALFGDEGKGSVVDRLAADLGGPTVVRHNGGPQAAHTVEIPDGRRHVFGHVGSGAFAGSSTHLSRFFASNPRLLLNELRELDALGVRPAISADPRGPVTTPWDVAVNRILEEFRGAGRHGSCGVGFGETMARVEEGGPVPTVADLADPDHLRALARTIRDDWAPRRLRAAGLDQVPAARRYLFVDDAVLEAFVEDGRAVRDLVETAGDASLRGPVVFEASQGLLLDRARGWFPHVTRSRTGLDNVVTLAAGAGLRDLEAFHVVRAYATRHGAGPLPREELGPPPGDLADPTNVPNPHQGSLRFAPLDVDLAARTVRADVDGARTMPDAPRITPTLVATCLDQPDPGRHFHIRGGRPEPADPSETAASLRVAAGVDRILVSRGPSRPDVAHRAS